MLDTHPDFALEYGMKRLKNIKDGGGGHVEDIIIGCGNCYRMYSDFKPSMDVEYDQAEDLDFSIHFLIHLIAEHVC